MTNHWRHWRYQYPLLHRLPKAASALRSGLRRVDRVYRYSGAAFSILLPVRRLENGQQVAERLQQRMQRAFTTPDGCSTLTISLGVAVGPYHGVTSDDLIAAADAALDEAKAQGRNRTVSASRYTGERLRRTA